MRFGGVYNRARTFPDSRIVEHHQRLDSFELFPRYRADIDPVLTVNGQTLRVVRDSTRRRWLGCPVCDQKMRYLYLHDQQIACRHCLKLQYASHNRHRNDPAAITANIICRLRQRIGVASEPFAPMPPISRARRRTLPIIAKIVAAEARLLELMRSFNSVLQHHADCPPAEQKRRARVREANRKFHAEHRAERLEYMRRRRATKKPERRKNATDEPQPWEALFEARRKKDGAWRAKNREAFNARHRERHRHRRQNDPAFRERVREYSRRAYLKSKAAKLAASDNHEGLTP